ncbi:MAG: TRAP transporter small permease subunit [Deltaproteobacteria bacterium]|nr:TRAP transporter small permease subunit [Deltaproteobacteria bacterium]
MKRAMKLLSNLLDYLCSICWRISGFAIAIMAFVITYNTIRRYLFNQQDNYAYVTTCILVVICVMFAIPKTESLHENLKINLLDQYFSKSVQNFIENFMGPFLGFICISIMTWKSWTPAISAYRTGDTYGSGAARVVTWPTRMVVVFGAGLLCVILLTHIVSYFVSLKRKDKADRD